MMEDVTWITGNGTVKLQGDMKTSLWRNKVIKLLFLAPPTQHPGNKRMQIIYADLGLEYTRLHIVGEEEKNGVDVEDYG